MSCPCGRRCPVFVVESLTECRDVPEVKACCKAACRRSGRVCFLCLAPTRMLHAAVRQGNFNAMLSRCAPSAWPLALIAAIIQNQVHQHAPGYTGMQHARPPVTCMAHKHALNAWCSNDNSFGSPLQSPKAVPDRHALTVRPKGHGGGGADYLVRCGRGSMEA